MVGEGDREFHGGIWPALGQLRQGGPGIGGEAGVQFGRGPYRLD